jgi:hypothetical protein
MSIYFCYFYIPQGIKSTNTLKRAELWFKNGLLHGGTGIEGEAQPAIELLNGHTEWREDGYLHRDDGPAVITQQGTWEEFWLHGELMKIRVFGTVEITGAQKD